MMHYTVKKEENELWLEEQEYDPAYAGKTEAVFAQCNGYLGVRASHALPNLDDHRGMFVAGVFNKAYPDEVTELVNCPDLTRIELKLEEEAVSMDRQTPEHYSRGLNLQTGELREELVCTLKSGLKLKLRLRRFASMEEEHLFAQQVSVTVLNRDTGINEIVTGIDARQTNSGVSHFKRADCRVYDKKYMETKGILEEDTLSVMASGCITGTDAPEPEFTLKRRSIFGKYRWKASAGQTCTFEKFAYIQKEEDGKSLEYQKNYLVRCERAGYEKMLLRHRKKMEELWADAGIQIRGADLEEEAAIAFALYHLMGMMPWKSAGSSIAAKGLTGEGYKGHVFWDTEIFILPFFEYTFPQAARHLLKYRYRGLEGAREKAKEYGYRGAMYPWETAKTGREETPLYAALNIHTGKANKVWSGVKEHHVTADIAYAVWQYYRITGDWEFMEKYGCEILFEAAEFWTSRCSWDEERKRYTILDVIGPDEYTEHVDNNTYTNYMARLCVSIAADLYEDISENDPVLFERLDTMLHLTGRIGEWREVKERLYLPVPGADGIIPQDDTFLEKKQLPDIEKYCNAPEKQTVLLDYSRDEVVDMQVLKQADVVMLLNLFPYWFDKKTVRKNVHFYEARTIHDSSLSYCAHAQACAAIGDMEAADRFFRKSLMIDLDNCPNDSAEGVHAASMGGIWNCVISGFAGVSFSKDSLRIEPKLPKHWEEIDFYIHVRGRKIHVTIGRDQIFLKGQKQEKALSVIVKGKEYMLEETLCISNEKEEEARAVIFDLDGVIADTAKYHYLAWKRLAAELGFEFGEEHNERLKGVSRMRSLEIVLETGGITGLLEEEKQKLADRKNRYYLEMISKLDRSEILPGIPEFLRKLREQGYKTALGSASKSGGMILEKLGLDCWFDAVVDGNLVEKPKPDPQVFLKAAEELQVPYQNCTVVEDAAAGVEAAKAGGMKCIGIGEKELLKNADIVIPDTSLLPELGLPA